MASVFALRRSLRGIVAGAAILGLTLPSWAWASPRVVTVAGRATRATIAHRATHRPHRATSPNGFRRPITKPSIVVPPSRVSVFSHAAAPSTLLQTPAFATLTPAA